MLGFVNCEYITRVWGNKSVLGVLRVASALSALAQRFHAENAEVTRSR
jgi:hypothetical protein